MYENLGFPAMFKIDNDLDKQNENLSKLKTSEKTCFASMDTKCFRDMISLPSSVLSESKSVSKGKTKKQQKSMKPKTRKVYS